MPISILIRKDMKRNKNLILFLDFRRNKNEPKQIEDIIVNWKFMKPIITIVKKIKPLINKSFLLLSAPKIVVPANVKNEIINNTEMRLYPLMPNMLGNIL